MAGKTVIESEAMTTADRREVDAQVQRILHHPLFQGSKKLPGFLRHIVEESLKAGGHGSVKERTLGIEVFGRKPDYDNNSDPVVRVTATELRKKLAQYYYEAGASEKIWIELPAGTYLPRFRKMETKEQGPQSGTLGAAPEIEGPTSLETADQPLLAGPTDPSLPKRLESPAATRSTLYRVTALLFLLACGIALSTHLGLSRLLRMAFATDRPTHVALDEFWAQLASRTNRVGIVMPVIGSDNLKRQGPADGSVTPNLSLEDTDIAARIASQLERQGLQFQLLSSQDLSLDRLQTEPSVLIGALDNVWTIRLMKDLPLTFAEAPDHRTGLIVEAGDKRRVWSVDIDVPHGRIEKDFGIVAHFTSHLTGQPVVVIAGISSQGTQAAGRMLTSKEVELLRGTAPHSANFEVLIETDAVEGHAGQPRVLAVKTW